jgi:hypothetical protein
VPFGWVRGSTPTPYGVSLGAQPAGTWQVVVPAWLRWALVGSVRG